MTSRGAPGLVSAWSASRNPRTVRANSTIACWKPHQVPTSGTPRSRAWRTAARAPSMRRYGLAGAIQMPSYAARRSPQSPSASVAIHSKGRPTCPRASFVNWWVRFFGSKSPTTAITGFPLVIVPACPAESLSRDRRLDHRTKALHPLDALGKGLAAEVEHDLAHAEPGVGRDVVGDLIDAAREGAPLPTREPLQLRIVDRRLVADRERFRVAAGFLGEPIQLVEQRVQLRRGQRDRGIGAHRVPAVAEARDPAQRGLAVAAHPDRRMGLLDRLGEKADAVEAVEPARER